MFFVPDPASLIRAFWLALLFKLLTGGLYTLGALCVIGGLVGLLGGKRSSRSASITATLIGICLAACGFAIQLVLWPPPERHTLTWDLSAGNDLWRADWPPGSTQQYRNIEGNIDITLVLPGGETFVEHHATHVSCTADDMRATSVSFVSIGLPKMTAADAHAYVRTFCATWGMGGSIPDLDAWLLHPADTFCIGRRGNHPMVDLRIGNSFDDKKPWWVSLEFCVDKQPVAQEIVSAFDAVERKDIDTLSRILSSGLDPEAWNPDWEETLLHAAARTDWSEAIETLLAAGVAVDCRDSRERTPLWEAVLYDHFQFAEVLLHRGANVNARSSGGRTLLHQCVDGTGLFHLVPWLIDRGAEIDARRDNGDTPLHVAASRGFVEPVTVLLVHGADRNLENTEGETPLELAERYDREDVVVLLKTLPPIEE